MRNILILIILITGLILTSLIKNKTRLLEKELVNLNNEINNLSFSLAGASLDFEYLTTPKNISFLAENFLDENFSHYNKSIDETFWYFKKSQVKNITEQKKNSVGLKKSINYNTISELSIEKSINNNLYLANNIDNTRLSIARKNNNTKPQIQKKKIVSKKVKKWIGVQVIKSLLGIPSMPAID